MKTQEPMIGIGEMPDYTITDGSVWFYLAGLKKIAMNCGQLETLQSWIDGQSAYCISIRKDTGRTLSTVMFEQKAIDLGYNIDPRFKMSHLKAFATRVNLETHFEHEIELVRKELMK